MRNLKFFKEKLAVLLIFTMIISEAGMAVNIRAAEDISDNSAVLAGDVLESTDDVLLTENVTLSSEDKEGGDTLTEFEEEVTDIIDDAPVLTEDGIAEVTADSALSAGMIIKDGMAQPMVSYSEIKKGYTNKGSDILRFAVYVETDYDTDLDGKNDLIQAVVQVPKAAAEGKYDAPAIFEASPYFAGTSSVMKDETKVPKAQYDETFHEDELYKPGTPHTVSGSAISSVELASRDNEAAFSSKNWFYSYDFAPNNNFLDGLFNHDYFLIRGFAVVVSAGLGTNGSEGLSCCGSRVEAEAFKDVVEWINGKEGRAAFADKEGTIPIKADWANGKVAMRGCSYNGTMAYEVAALGAEGLETVVPEAAISSWYEYSNTQGVSHYLDNKYTSSLARGNSSRFYGLDPKGSDKDLRELCSKLFGSFDHSQEELAGHYGDYWTGREFSNVEAGKIKASALIVQGFNDYNVRTKQADLMMKAFERSGRDVKLILHQGAHETLESIMLGDMYYEDLLNKWYCHYLLNIDNGIEKSIPNVWVQSNIDGYFTLSYNEWYKDEWYSDPSKSITLSSGNADRITLEKPEKVSENKANDKEVAKSPSVTSGDIMKSGDDPYFTIDDFFDGLICNDKGEGPDGKLYSETWIRRVPKEITIQGKPEIHVRASVPEVPQNGRMVLGAMLYDISTESFPVYDTFGEEGVKHTVRLRDFIDRGKGIDPIDLEEFKAYPVKSKLITKGVIDLGSPECGYLPTTAVKGSATANTYYDYTIHMLPTVYTVRPGHYLWLYLIPGMDGVDSDVNVNIDNGYSCVNIPVTKVPEDFVDNMKEDYVDDGSGNKVISEVIGGKEVSRKIIDNSERIVTVSSNLWIKGLSEEYVYMGVPVKPEFKIYDGTDPMVANRDYKISYSNNNKPTEISGKDSIITITFKGEYVDTGKIQKTFKIAKATLSDDKAKSDVYVSDTSVAYTGRSLKPIPEIRYENENGDVINSKNFRFSYIKDGSKDASDSVSEAGHYTVIIEPADAKSYFTGVMRAGLTVTDNKNVLLENAKVKFDPGTYVYTGVPIVPEEGKYTLSLKLDGRNYTTLSENKDYRKKLVRNNTDPGKAEVVFTAIPGNDKGITGSVKGSFKITKGRVLQAPGKGEFTYSYQNYVAYEKSGAQPSWLYVYDGDRLLEKGKDYTVSFKNNKTISKEAKMAQMIIKGKGLYKGTVTMEFCVTPANIDQLNLYVKDKIMPKTLPADGKGYVDPDITITDVKGKKLKKGTDYKISSYQSVSVDSAGQETKSSDIDGTKQSKILITIDGVGNYFGSVSAYYMYYDKNRDLSKVTVYNPIKDKVYTGSEIYLTQGELYELLVDGRTKINPGTYLNYKDDFYVESYKNNINSGTASVVLRGTGKYGGTITLKFKIKRQGAKSILDIVI